MAQAIKRRQILKGAAVAIGVSATSPIMSAISSYAATTDRLQTVFTNDEKLMIEIIAEMIIPKTDTPGAGEAGVPEFIDDMVSNWYPKNERKQFIDGLRYLNHHSLISFGKKFLDLDDQQKTITLEDLEQNVSGTMSDGKLGGKSDRPAIVKSDPALWGEMPYEGRDFFNQIKSLTVLGYYTSEIGIENELIYDPVPGSYDGSFDFDTNGKHFTS